MQSLILTQHWGGNGIWGGKKVNNLFLGTYINNYNEMLGVNTLVFRVQNINL